MNNMSGANLSPKVGRIKLEALCKYAELELWSAPRELLGAFWSCEIVSKHRLDMSLPRSSRLYSVHNKSLSMKNGMLDCKWTTLACLWLQFWICQAVFIRPRLWMSAVVVRLCYYLLSDIWPRAPFWNCRCNWSPVFWMSNTTRERVQCERKARSDLEKAMTVQK